MEISGGGSANVLQERTRLSQSIIWDLQDAFYRERNIKSWSEGIVPNFVTSNSFIAFSYAKVILGYIRDWLARY